MEQEMKETNTPEDEGGKHGRFLGIPYDWRKPTGERAKSRMWNPDEHRIFVPRTFGWGYTINFYEVGRRLHLLS